MATLAGLVSTLTASFAPSLRAILLTSLICHGVMDDIIGEKGFVTTQTFKYRDGDS